MLVMKCSAALAFLSASLIAVAQQTPKEWVDAETGHRIVQLSEEPGSGSLYFNLNGYTPDGKKLLITTPHGMAFVDLGTRRIEPLSSDPHAHPIMVGHKTGRVYFVRDGAVWYLDPATKKETKIAEMPPHGSIATVNADETLLAGTYVEPQGSEKAQQLSPPPRTREGRGHMLEERYNAHLPMALFTLNIKTGEKKVLDRSTEWLNHLLFSPTDPSLLMFCHEGPWHKVDRIWLIHTDGTGPMLVHKRRMQMEIAGHEFWSQDGKTIWYDLQTPRGEDFWVAGYNVYDGHRTWWHLQRNEWSVHYNVSPDGTLFAGDGGDSKMVAHAPDGKWIYLFHPVPIPNMGVEEKDLITPGVFQAEKLVNMSKHDYALEPNVNFTPDGKWIVFRSNMSGQEQVYAVEVAREPVHGK
ncbi:MAG: oligogalacturonate lyase family protein [Bacillota bacterium]|nr:oligogalacturonate lyase family protein [Pseudacidobacterium ailaaui]MDI3254737.1 oligogalacturonate lyase family protein [Bacillota bacterium]